MNKNFECYRVEGNGEKGEWVSMSVDKLHLGDVTIEVKYSGLNYKDALSAQGHKGITKNYPHTPGIDAAGVVIDSKSEEFKPGQKVIVTSYDLGMNTHGGFSEVIRVPAAWVVPLPDGMTLKESMTLGTAGFTAALALSRMEAAGQTPDMGPVLVTGATGGVGLASIKLLKKAGYQTIASTGSLDKAKILEELGCESIIQRSELQNASSRPLHRWRWAGVIDTVGGVTLSEAMKYTRKYGSIAVCGLVESPTFETTVFPFILNGINLLGVESAEYPMSKRKELWVRLQHEWRISEMEEQTREIKKDELGECLWAMLEGKSFGRVVLAL